MTLSITLIICALTFLISYQAFNDRKLFENLKHFPYAESRRKEFYRMVTSGFVHGSWMHLLINLFVLYQFGGIVESLYGQIFGKSMGSIMFTLMYITTLIVADIPSYLKHKNDPHYGAIGASGAVLGLAGAMFITLWGRGVSPTKSPVFGLVALNLGLPLLIPGISFWGHFGGVVAGGAMAYIMVWLPEHSRIRSGRKNITQGTALAIVMTVACFITANRG